MEGKLNHSYSAIMNLFRRDFYLPPHQMANSLLWTQISNIAFLLFIYIKKENKVKKEKEKKKEEKEG